MYYYTLRLPVIVPLLFGGIVLRPPPLLHWHSCLYIPCLHTLLFTITPPPVLCRWLWGWRWALMTLKEVLLCGDIALFWASSGLVPYSCLITLLLCDCCYWPNTYGDQVMWWGDPCCVLWPIPVLVASEPNCERGMWQYYCYCMTLCYCDVIVDLLVVNII